MTSPKFLIFAHFSLFSRHFHQGTELGLVTMIEGKKRKYRPFAEARNFVRSLKLKNLKEWQQYCKGTLRSYEPRPKDIPSSPSTIYQGKDWQGYGDWVGNGRIARSGKRNHRSLTEARSFVHTLKLKNGKEWLQYCKGALKGYERRPLDIPSNPRRIYKDQGWQSMYDWLGTEITGCGGKKRNYRSLTEARSFVHTLKLKERV